MTHRMIILLTIFLFACDNGKTKKKDYPPLIRYVQSDNRICNSREVENFSTVDDLLADFYAYSQFKDSFELNLRLGAFYYYQKSYGSSLSYYLKARNINSSDANIHFNIALTYSELNRFNDALNSINASLAICGDKWEQLNSKCYILGNLDSCEQAIKFGLISFNMNPDNKKIYGNLLDCFDKLDQRDSVTKYIDFAIKKFNLPTDIATKLKHKYHY